VNRSLENNQRQYTGKKDRAEINEHPHAKKSNTDHIPFTKINSKMIADPDVK
jgi:hypothetical protein